MAVFAVGTLSHYFRSLMHSAVLFCVWSFYDDTSLFRKFVLAFIQGSTMLIKSKPSLGSGVSPEKKKKNIYLGKRKVVFKNALESEYVTVVPRRVIIYHGFVRVVTASIVLLGCLQFWGDQNLSGYPQKIHHIFGGIWKELYQTTAPTQKNNNEAVDRQQKGIGTNWNQSIKEKAVPNGQPNSCAFTCPKHFFPGRSELGKTCQKRLFVEKTLVPGFQVMCFFQCIFTPWKFSTCCL